ncbi:uncharacterized protein LOC123309128 isoform X3 [Coccinella septempunctata]|uniref:uncharacterized protein LOC123309128 isoform X3 n=1 Tax=Coccinella septempunctata TaxID=41139 RepID=UPI001D0741AD|nr:uncharacterized protein LOC123309128 isoform X3 [Coccinella septempunctata]
MSSWAARMHRRAATFSNVVTSCGHPSGPYPRRLEKVKFGVPLEEVCKNDIPGPLLVLILKLNKEAPYRKDVFRAPGNQGVMKKLIHFLQTGRLVNIDNFSVYTIASVLKKFLRKIPGGVFGRELENRLFEAIEMEDLQRQRDEIHRILTSLPVYTQHILVLLFGTFRVIASNSEKHCTGMTSEALGVSVAPSFFHSCVHDGRVAKMEDVMKFKIASKIVKHLIEEFATSDLFGRENYEFYARVTGRVLRVQGQWICSFQYPPVNVKDPVFPNEFIALEPYLIGHLSLGSDTWLRCDLELSQTDYSLEAFRTRTYLKYSLFSGHAGVEECQSTPALLEVTQPQVSSSSLGIITEHSLLESCTRLSISLEQNGLFQAGNNTSHSSSGSHSSRTSQNHSGPKMTLDELKEVNKYAESTKSLTYLPQVHERQTERMKTRSQWFLAPSVDCCSCGGSVDMLLEDIDVKTLTNALMRRSSSGTIVGIAGLSLSAESVQKRPSIRRSNSRDKRSYLHRSTSRRAKQNGSRSNSFKNRERKISNSKSGSFKMKYGNISRSCSLKNKAELCSCPSNNNEVPPVNEEPKSTVLPTTAKKTTETICITLTYKPRI